MKCKEIGELLLTYLDEEVSPEEREAIEAHLSACSSCREELEALAATQRKLRQGLNLVAAGASPSPHAWATIKERLAREERSRIPLLDLAKSKIRGGMKRLRSRPLWQKALASTLTVALIIGVSLLVPARGSQGCDFEGVLEMVRLAHSQVHSYRCQHMEISWYEISDTLREGWRTEESDWEGAYSAPDRASMRRTVWIKLPGWLEHDVNVLETVYVGDKVYRRQAADTGWRVGDTSPVDEGWLLATTNPIWAEFDSLTGVEQLRTEKINGIECLHYKGRADMEAYIDKLSDIHFVNDMEKEWLRHMDKTVEIWIGQNDYLVRKYDVYARNPYSMPNAEALSTPAGPEPRYTSTGVTEFYDYNEAVQIEAPMVGGVTFADPNLEAAIREAIGKPEGSINESDLEELTSLQAIDRGIANLTGLEYCTNLTELFLSSQEITDITPLEPLTSLTMLFLADNEVSDITPLAKLTNLTILMLDGNNISDITALSTLTSLTALSLHHNRISTVHPLSNLQSLGKLDVSDNQVGNVTPLSNLTNLTYLRLRDNQISDITPLSNLTTLQVLYLGRNRISEINSLSDLANLTDLWLDHNQITDIEPLVNNEGLSEGDTVNLRDNPLSTESINVYIPQLEARGVEVLW